MYVPVTISSPYKREISKKQKQSHAQCTCTCTCNNPLSGVFSIIGV